MKPNYVFIEKQKVRQIVDFVMLHIYFFFLEVVF